MGVSLKGGLIAGGGAILLFLLFKGQRLQNSGVSFLSFHWISFAYAFVYPSPSSYFITALLVFLRELTLLLQNTQNQQTRASLLVGLGALTLPRRNGSALHSSIAFAILAISSALAVAYGPPLFSHLNDLPVLIFAGCWTHVFLNDLSIK